MSDENLHELFQIMTRRFGLLNKNCCGAGGHDISLIQSQILYEIDHQYKPSMQQVAESLGTDITTFSRQVQSLIRLNLVNKVADPDDKRISVLSLTTEGQYVARSIDQQINGFLDEVFSHMSEFEQETVIRSIKLLNGVMAKSNNCCKSI